MTRLKKIRRVPRRKIYAALPLGGGLLTSQIIALAMKNISLLTKDRSLVFTCPPPLLKASQCKNGGVI